MGLSIAQADWIKLDHTSVRLVSEYQRINGKTPFWLLIEFSIKPGWHTYWLNPGDSGITPKFNFNLPEGYKVSSVRWLPPSRIPAGSFLNYGYTGEAYHIIKIEPNPVDSSPIIPIEVDASWLVCEEECIPESAILTLNLQKGDENLPSPFFDQINTLLAKTNLPSLTAEANILDGRLHLQFARKLEGEIYFYPEQKGIIEPGKPQIESLQDNHTHLNIVRGSLTPEYPVKGVLEITHNTHSTYYSISANYSAPAETDFLPLLLLFALLGGLILNLMPCVFPVLSLKVLALKSATNKRLQGIFYTLGVMAAFAVIAGIMIILQSFGNNIGWGFQLQSPLFNISLIFLFTLIALNLFGFFEIPFSMNANLTWQKNHKYLYSFATGILACVVATPCSAPFMATAIGVALTKSAVVALLIFMFLGLGLALPYLLVCFIPAIAKLLPRPGPWMETIRQLLAFPMLLSVIWLLWVLGQQVQFDAVILLMVSLCALLFTFWLKNRIKPSLTKLILMLLCISLVLYPLYSIVHRQLLSHSQPLEHTRFSPEKLDELLKKRQKVFVYATAAWCITCKVNEKIALDTQEVKQFLTKEKIHVLKADWTNRDDTILKYLQSFGRAGVPLYVYYAPEQQPMVLPQLLTPNLIIETIKGESN